ncbi:sex-regulated protein janus-A [Drosophila grimshawi]|uniref:Sex-regulated protein janus-A n=1 Tax=Drosophila grimshawi TaxID=7222 RepID=B4JER5_DROGR|nr:sex-regulated protein janus-A [Drosophila grimshawi]EDV93196.1 GH18401 [Drosophila grimshawi]
MTEKDVLALPLVDIDGAGIFKYVLIKITGSEDSREVEKNVVRGYADCQWHSDIYDRVMEVCKEKGLDTQCLGGGRIEHNPDKKYLKVYGYSQGFGKADHMESKRILQTKYSDYEIETTDEGY